MPKPKLLGVDYGPKAAGVKTLWEHPPASTSESDRRLFAARLKSLRTFEFRAK